jgi:hypothetical protein
LANAADAPFLPAMERSAGEAFRAIGRLSCVADAADLSVERYVALIAGGELRHDLSPQRDRCP